MNLYPMLPSIVSTNWSNLNLVNTQYRIFNKDDLEKKSNI